MEQSQLDMVKSKQGWSSEHEDKEQDNLSDADIQNLTRDPSGKIIPAKDNSTISDKESDGLLDGNMSEEDMDMFLNALRIQSEKNAIANRNKA